MVTMTATKMLTYNNRRLVPGEDFEAKSQRDLKVLLATRKAKVKRIEAEIPPPPPELSKRIAEVAAPINEELNDLTAARGEYERAIGRKPYYGWDAATLREKIVAAGVNP